MKSNRRVLRGYLGVILVIILTLTLLFGCGADNDNLEMENSELENSEMNNVLVEYAETGNENAVGGREFTVSIRNETSDIVGLELEGDLEEDWNDGDHYIDVSDFSSASGEEVGTTYSEQYNKTFIDSVDTGNGFKATLYLIAGTNNDGTYWEAPFVIEKVEVEGNWGDHIIYGFDGTRFSKLDN